MFPHILLNMFSFSCGIMPLHQNYNAFALNLHSVCTKNSDIYIAMYVLLLLWQIDLSTYLFLQVARLEFLAMLQKISLNWSHFDWKSIDFLCISNSMLYSFLYEKLIWPAIVFERLRFLAILLKFHLIDHILSES